MYPRSLIIHYDFLRNYVLIIAKSQRHIFQDHCVYHTDNRFNKLHARNTYANIIISLISEIISYINDKYITIYILVIFK